MKEGIIGAQSVLRVKYSKSQALMAGMGAEKLYSCLERIACGELRRGWQAWMHSTHVILLDQRISAYLHFLGMRLIAQRLSGVVSSVLSEKFFTWKAFNEREKFRLQVIRELQAALTIQRVVRGYFGRIRANAEREIHKYQKMYEATIRLQSFFRMKVARWRYLKQLKEAKQDAAARLLQRVFKGHVARKFVRMLSLQKKRNLAAIKIQCCVRQRIARKKANSLRERYKTNLMAAKVQAVIRGFLVRRMVKMKGENDRKNHAVMRIQALIRGKLVRKYLQRRRKDLMEQRSIRIKAVIKIQSAYRGYRSYLKSRILMLELERRRKQKALASTKICNMVRCFLARARRRKLEKARYLAWLSSARSWQEIWAEDSESWFYFNAATGEALWEPPRDGYIKADGKLVLASGEIIDDPRQKKLNIFGEEEDEEDERQSKTICSECNERHSIKKCNECGDGFCTICYKQTHASGARRNHTFVPTGLIDCTECEAKLAERWCVACDESFCDSCWRKVHSRGNRRFHPFHEVSLEGRVDARIFTLDGQQVCDLRYSISFLLLFSDFSQVDSYDSTHALQRNQAEPDSSAVSNGTSNVTEGQ